MQLCSVENDSRRIKKKQTDISYPAHDSVTRTRRSLDPTKCLKIKQLFLVIVMREKVITVTIMEDSNFTLFSFFLSFVSGSSSNLFYHT